MGKVRIKTYGEEESQEEKIRKRQEKQAKKAAKTEHKDTAEVSVEKPNKEASASQKEEKADIPNTKTEKKKKEKHIKKTVKSKRYNENVSAIQKDTLYTLNKALNALKTFKKVKFDETVELHLNVKEKGISGQVVLPHGTGKKLRIKIADDAIISEIEKGKIDFDILVAAPQMMPKLGKVARILGPRGLMPNPKNGTISPNPEKVIEELTRGRTNYKTESEAPIIHVSVGKISFSDAALSENIRIIISSIGANRINNVTLKSTMSPGLKLDIAKI